MAKQYSWVIFNRTKVMHLRTNYKNFCYELGMYQLQTEEEKSLDMLIGPTLVMSYHCDMATKKSNAILGCSRREIE